MPVLKSSLSNSNSTLTKSLTNMKKSLKNTPEPKQFFSKLKNKSYSSSSIKKQIQYHSPSRLWEPKVRLKKLFFFRKSNDFNLSWKKNKTILARLNNILLNSKTNKASKPNLPHRLKYLLNQLNPPQNQLQMNNKWAISSKSSNKVKSIMPNSSFHLKKGTSLLTKI